MREPPDEARLEIGRIARPHGIRGEVVVDPVTNRPERFEPGAVHHGPDRTLVVERARSHKGRWIVGYEGVADRDAAEALRGAVLTAERLDTERELWAHELIGAQVVDASREPQGRVVSVEVNPAHDILVLDSGALVPVVFIRDFDGTTVVVDAPEGLFDQEFVEANRPAVERRPARRKGRRRS